MSSPAAGRSGSMWSGPPPSPPSSGDRQAGIGCKIYINDRKELCVRMVIAGGPAAFSCQVAVDDVLTKVDGINVMGETVDEVAKRIVGPEGVAIKVTFKIKRKGPSAGKEVYLENVVTMIRQQPVIFPEKLVTPSVGLGVELRPVDDGLVEVCEVKEGGAAAIGGFLQVGDKLVSIDGKELHKIPPNADKGLGLVGEPFSRVSLMVLRGKKLMVVDAVRIVMLRGEYLLKQQAYKNSLGHAILQPDPPQFVQPARSLPEGGSHIPANSGTGGRQRFKRADITGLDTKFDRVMDPGDAHAHSSPQASYTSARNEYNSPSVQGITMTSCSSGFSASQHSVEDRSITSVDGMLSRSSTASRDSIALSRDSIALSVRQNFGEHYDFLRTVEGREATFTDEWPHVGNPKLLKGKMANAGFIFTPEGNAPDKVTCVYCGLELGMWEPGDDPWSEHHEGSPGCSFWRRSSTAGEKLSREMFNGYGSPYHSLFRSAGSQLAAEFQQSLAMGGVPPSHDFQRTIQGSLVTTGHAREGEQYTF